MHLVGVAQRLAVHLRHTDAAYKAILHQSADGSNGLFCGNIGIDTVGLIQIDVICTELFQRYSTGGASGVSTGGVTPAAVAVSEQAIKSNVSK